MEQSNADHRGTLGRYALFGEIASGGMATVHLGRLLGSIGFARTVAIKRLHPHLAKDPDFVNMFLEEARLAARVRHPNVVTTLDVVCDDNELFLVMEYVPGESLSRLVRKTREAGKRIPTPYVIAMMCAALDGLQAAHDAVSERGQALGIVHRDVSPQNIHVGIDGVARVLDFGIAKATNRVQETRTDQIKGKVAYMSPEQLAKGPIDRRADVYSASVVLWEALTCRRLFKADDVPGLVYSIINDDIHPPSIYAPDLDPALDAIVMKGLDREAKNRWSSTREMAEALEKVIAAAPPREIGKWVRETAGDALEWRIELMQSIESETSTSIPPPLLRAARDHGDGGGDPDSASSSSIKLTSGIKHRTPAAFVSPTQDVSASSAQHQHQHQQHEEEEVEAVPAAPLSERGSVAELTQTTRRSHRKRTMTLGFIALALILLGGGFVGFRFIQLNNDDANANPTPSASASSGNEAAIIVEVARSASAAKPTVTAPPPPTASATPVAPVQTAAAVTAQPPPAAPTGAATIAITSLPLATASAPPAKPTPPSADCQDPFTVDSKGHHHPKPQCFRR